MRLVLYLVMTLFLSIGCSDKKSSSGRSSASSNSLPTVAEMCSKIESVMQADAPDFEACTSKLSGLQDKDNQLFLDVAKCIKKASDADEIEACNDSKNPRYRKVAPKHRAGGAGEVRSLCERAMALKLEKDTDLEDCEEKMNALKKQNRALFGEVSQCVAESSNEEEIASCNDNDNPRYRGLK